MALQIDGAVAIRKNGRDGNHVTILDVKPGKRVFRSLLIRSFDQVYAQHLFALMRLNSLDLDSVQLTGNRNAACQIKHLIQGLLTAEFVNCRPPHLARNRHLSACGRNQDAVTRFNMDLTPAHAFQHQVIEINVFHQRLAAIVLHNAIGASVRGPSSGDQGAQGSGERADVISAGILHVANDVNPHRAQPAQRHVNGNAAQLPAEQPLNRLLHLAQRTSRHHNGAGLRKRYASFTVNRALQVL